MASRARSRRTTSPSGSAGSAGPAVRGCRRPAAEASRPSVVGVGVEGGSPASGRARARWRAEVHLRRTALTDRVLHLEELLFLEVEHVRHDHRRELLHPSVVVAYVRVVEAPGGLQAILGVRELTLQLQEVLVRLQVRVVLHHDHQLSEGGHQRSLGRSLLRGGPCGAGSHRTGARDVLEHLLLMGGVTLHRLDEVRDQVVPSAEFSVDVRPCVLDQGLLRNEPVVRDDGADRNDHDQHEQHEQQDLHERSPSV